MVLDKYAVISLSGIDAVTYAGRRPAGYTRGRCVQDTGVDTRVTIREAATLLGISEGAVRKRVDRGTLQHDKGPDGKVYVYLPGVARNGDPDGDDASTPHESNTLISEMRSRIDFLEEEMRRKDAILMNMTEAMKALTAPKEASSEERESRDTASGSTDRGEVYTEPQESAQPRSWLYRFFFGPS